MSWFKILARSPTKAQKNEAPPKPRRKAKGKALTKEDHAVWAHIARSVTPLEGRVLPPEPEALPPVKVAPAPDHPPLAEPPRAPALPPLARLEKRALRKISRGGIEIDGRLDLHGMRQAEAHAALHAFLYRQHHAGARLVIVITGKGARNPGAVDARGDERGILRRLVPHWLADPAMRRIIMGFESAAQHHGGEGALYVRLRRHQA